MGEYAVFYTLEIYPYCIKEDNIRIGFFNEHFLKRLAQIICEVVN